MTEYQNQEPEVKSDHFVSAESICLLWRCAECGIEADQPLSSIEENGTLTCDCGLDMELMGAMVTTGGDA